MKIPYFRNPYDPDIDDTQSSGGLLALLQAAMQRGASPGVDPAASPGRAGGYGLPDARGLVRPVSFQGDQDFHRPTRVDTAPTQSPARDDFRQVSRAPIVSRAQGNFNSANLPSDGPDLSFGRGSGGPQDSSDLSATSRSPLGDLQASKGNAKSPNAKVAQVVVLPDGFPLPPMPGGLGSSRSLPQIPNPHISIPDSWKALWALPRSYLWAMFRYLHRPPEKDGDGQSMPPDPNFGQVPRASSVNRMQGAIDTSPQFPVQSRPIAPFGASPSLDPSAAATGGAVNPASPISGPFYGASSTPFAYPMAPRKGEEDEDEDKEPNPDEWVRRFREGVKKRAAERGNFTPDDPGDECTRQYDEDMKACFGRSDEYTDWDYLEACQGEAAKRLADCRNNRVPRERWGPNKEETYRNYSR